MQMDDKCTGRELLQQLKKQHHEERNSRVSSLDFLFFFSVKKPMYLSVGLGIRRLHARELRSLHVRHLGRLHAILHGELRSLLHDALLLVHGLSYGLLLDRGEDVALRNKQTLGQLLADANTCKGCKNTDRSGCNALDCMHVMLAQVLYCKVTLGCCCCWNSCCWGCILGCCCCCCCGCILGG
jgi:hypothetical protein